MNKDQLREKCIGKEIAGVRFLAAGSDIIRECGCVPVITDALYENGDPEQPTPLSVVDLRLGPVHKKLKCATCDLGTQDCTGHFGWIDLTLPVFHVGFFRHTIQTLQCVCKTCSHILLRDDQKADFLMKLRKPGGAPYLARKAMHSRIVELCKKQTECKHCGAKNGTVKKAVGAHLKIVHKRDTSEAATKQREIEHRYALKRDERKKGQTGQSIAEQLSNKFGLLYPTDVLRIFQNIPDCDVPLLLCCDYPMHHPADMIVQRVPVPPAVIRPAMVADDRPGTTEDDLTVKLMELVQYSNNIAAAMSKPDRPDAGRNVDMIIASWEAMQTIAGLYINSELSGVPQDLAPKKFMRSLAQRLKGKQGRFRGNLSGKRVDFCARTVISPDPNLKIDQVGIPLHVAKILTFPEVVNQANLERMREHVLRGPKKHPGANYVELKSGEKLDLRYGNKETLAMKLRPGDTVLRHLINDDVVLFNRQPSLHKISIMAHRAVVLPHRTLRCAFVVEAGNGEIFRFNESVCTPYNADFDGDEMNLHLPQTHEARAEAAELMAVRRNLVTPRSGEPLVAAMQDFITGAYLLTHKDTFLTRTEVFRLAMQLMDKGNCSTRIELPTPAILKPLPLWTGKQLFELLVRLRPTMKEDGEMLELNLQCPNKMYKQSAGQDTNAPEMDPDDNYVLIRNSQLLSGMLDKALVGSGSKNNVFHRLLRDHGEKYAVESMWRIARITPVYLQQQRGFSLGIGDVRPSRALWLEKKRLVNEGNAECASLMARAQSGKMTAMPGRTMSQTLEAHILRELSSIRDKCGQACVRSLGMHNAPRIMAISGSKGSFINISQMIVCVGQQAISGSRPADGFEHRSLPHFRRHDRSAPAKGFVENSFFSGMTCTEFYFHTMAGREGLVDTAVKTAETGYMQRRLVKCMEDLQVHYDGTVRNSSQNIVQFTFGEDGLDPSMMEAKDGSVLDLGHIYNHVRATLNEVTLPGEAHTPPLHPEKMHKVAEEMDSLFSCRASLCTQPVEEEFAPLEREPHFEKQVWKSAAHFAKRLKEFLHDAINRHAPLYSLPTHCEKHTRARAAKTTAKCESRGRIRSTLLLAHYCTKEQLKKFLSVCKARFRAAITEPGTAVGAVAATSLGEPSTQMTLKTFHFAGVASMNITQGVPRIKEIINAVKNISTPVIEAGLLTDDDEHHAKRVQMRLERTTLGDITERIESICKSDEMFLAIKLSAQRAKLLQLEVSQASIARALCQTGTGLERSLIPLKDQCAIEPRGASLLIVRPPPSTTMSTIHAMEYLKTKLPTMVIKGIKGGKRCVVHADEKTGKKYKLIVEGGSLLDVIATPGINPNVTRSNNALEMAKVLGIEAARKSIVAEIVETMAAHGIQLDVRHVLLLADLMTYRGEVIGVTRTGLARMKESVLMLASFETTMQHLYDAAFFGQRDSVDGVTECIVLGKPMKLGTGCFDILQNMRDDEGVSKEQLQLKKKSPWMDEAAMRYLK